MALDGDFALQQFPGRYALDQQKELVFAGHAVIGSAGAIEQVLAVLAGRMAAVAL